MFVRGGGVGPGDILDDAGNYGYYWSSVGGDGGSADYLYFYSGFVSPWGITSRRSGFSVRCVALGG